MIYYAPGWTAYSVTGTIAAFMRCPLVLIMLLSVATASRTRAAQPIMITVPGTADPWLAGMPDGSTASCYNPVTQYGCDFAPDESPALVTGLALVPGTTLTFDATGAVSFGEPHPLMGPDGDPTQPAAGHFTGAENGISNIVALQDALLGVFLGPNPPNVIPAPPPPTSNQTPLLQQVFLIGSHQTVTVPAGATRLFLAVKDGFGWYDNLGAFSVSIAVTSLITKVTMYDAHTLQIDVTAQLTNNFVPKSISVGTTPIGGDGRTNGIALDSSNCQQCSIALEPGIVGENFNSFRIDLSSITGGALPRFTENQIFDVSAIVSENGVVTQTDTKPANEIPLPVVHVHGILTDCIPGAVHPARIPTLLFAYLTQAHAYNQDTEFPELSVAYPTLVSFDYSSVGVDAPTAAASLQAWIWSQLLDPIGGKTYADKVNIVAHSLGGIVTRTAIMNGFGYAINRLILVGSPNEGATLAVVAYNLNAVGIASTLAQAIDWASFGNPVPSAIAALYGQTLSCLEQAQTSTTMEMFPTYPWYGDTQSDVAQGNLRIPAPNYVNPFLTNLDSLGLDPNVRYYTIISSNLSTPSFLWGRNWIIPPSGALWQGYYGGPQTAYTGGDGIVPGQSQAANDLAWPIGTGPGQLYRFDSVPGVFHTQYFEFAQVNQDVELIFWHTP